MREIEGNIIDIYNRKIYPGIISIANGKIVGIIQNSETYQNFISPGFIDAHIHIESSMLTPFQFSRLAIQRGTLAILNDPHEIANVMGRDGIDFMIESSREACIKIFFAIPSCVPATPFDSAGAVISASDVEELAESGDFIALSEVMNVPGVLNSDGELGAKLEIAKRYDLKIDGHAPMLSGEALMSYIRAGITTDHECSSLAEAEEKIEKGMKILIREGSAAKNYEALKPLIATHPNELMFCTDDTHPGDMISEGEIDKIVKKAIKDGFDLFDVLKIATINPVEYYDMPVGTLKEGDAADFIILENLESFHVLAAYIGGKEMYREGKSEIIQRDKPGKEPFVNHFNHTLICAEEIKKEVNGEVLAIKVVNGEIVTGKNKFKVGLELRNMESDLNRDILKIVYINRYQNTPPQIAFVNGFGLKQGAFATSISHDSHNILAVGCKDQDIVEAVNAVIGLKGGLAVKNKDGIATLPLPIGGIMTDQRGEDVAIIYEKLNDLLKKSGCILDAPFMTLAFMSLVVIPELKIGEKGLFDFSSFSFID